MAQSITLWVGTRKGGFVFRSRNRRTWKIEGPFCRGSEINHVCQDPRDPKRVYATVNSGWFGPHLHQSTDGGRRWRPSERGLEIKSLPGTSLKRLWQIRPGAADEPKVVYAGGDPGVLFRSENYGRDWNEVVSLNTHSTRKKWNPGAGGMCLHSIESLGGGRLVVAISAAGTFRSRDGGASWEPFNGGVLVDFQPEKYPEVGQCVHKLRAHPSDRELLFQQNHCGVYRARFDDEQWTDLSAPLPTRFGFGAAIAADAPETFFTCPMEGPEYRANLGGRFVVARTRNGGKSWKLLGKGLPAKNAHLTVLREAMDADPLSPAGVYVGSEQGQIFHTNDGGASWGILAENLPPVYSISVGVPE